MLDKNDHFPFPLDSDRALIVTLLRAVLGLAERLTGEMMFVEVGDGPRPRASAYITPDTVRWMKKKEGASLSDLVDEDLRGQFQKLSHTLAESHRRESATEKL